MLSVIMLNVVMLNVVMLSVIAPPQFMISHPIFNVDTEFIGLVKTSNFMFDQFTITKSNFAKLFL